MKLVTRKSTKFQSIYRAGSSGINLAKTINKAKFSFRYSFRFNKLKPVGLLILSAVLLTALTPLLKKSFIPKVANAATVTRTWQLGSSSSSSYVYNNYEVDLTSTAASLKTLPTTFNLSAGETNFLDAWSIYGAASVQIITDATSGDNQRVYSVTADPVFSSPTLMSKALIPVDPSLSYALSGDFKSTGAGGQSYTYLGLVPYDQYGQVIGRMTSRQEYFATGDAVTLTNFSNTTITTTGGNLATWNQGGSSPGHSRLIGFYFDGNTTHRPDYTLQYNYTEDPAPTGGSYSTASGSTINLNVPIPPEVQARIIKNTTKVRDQMAGSSYLYLWNGYPSINWATYGGSTITGSNTTQISSENLFPPDTKYVRFMILPNYGQGSAFSTSFDNIKLTVTGSQPTYSRHNSSVESVESQYFEGTPTSFSHVLGAGNQGEVRYQVSIDNGTNWKYYDTTAGAWKEAPRHQPVSRSAYDYGFNFIRDFSPLKANTPAEINANLFALTGSGGRFKWRAYFVSNGSQRVELQSVTFGAQSDQLAIHSVTPRIGQTAGGDTITIRGQGFSQEVTLSQVSAGYFYSCALGSDNQAYCWGDNYSGQLGNGLSGSANDSSTPVAVSQGAIPAGVNLVQISAVFSIPARLVQTARLTAGELITMVNSALATLLAPMSQ